MIIFMSILSLSILSLSIYIYKTKEQQKKLNDIIAERYGELEMIEIDTSMQYGNDK